MHDYCRGWVLGFLGFIKPVKFSQAEIGQVEGYLQKLAGEGKEIWQVRQAEESLRVFYQEVEPAGWAKHWPVDLMRGLEFGIREEGVSHGGTKNTKEAVSRGDAEGAERGMDKVDVRDAAPVPRPPTARGAAAFAGRTDTGELPGSLVLNRPGWRPGARWTRYEGRGAGSPQLSPRRASGSRF